MLPLRGRSPPPMLRGRHMSRRPRLFSWYRLTPLIVVAVFGVASALFSFAPSLFFGALYPLHHEGYIVQSSRSHGVDPYLVAAEGIVDGSVYSADNLFDAQTNIEFGCAYLSYLLQYFNGATDRAIAAYNAGMGNVDDWAEQDTVLHNAITFPETQAYLFRVTTAQERYEDLYPDSFLSQ